MQICIAGWYYYNECLDSLLKQPQVYIVAHRSGPDYVVPHMIINNIGLEFHCYDYFVKNIWDKKSDVLFCHDDIKIKDITFLEDIEKVSGDVVMVWHNIAHYKRNLAHGRMFKCSVNYLNKSNGFWWDANNIGCLDASKGCNNAVSKLYQNTKNITVHFYTDKIEMGKRGKLKT